MNRRFLGIEIGGTKLQLAVGDGSGAPFEALERYAVDAERGAEGILEAIAETALRLTDGGGIDAVGIGFGGPVDSGRGRVIRSHQIDGWEDMPLAEWLGDLVGAPVTLGNDCDVAALAEARFGAGRGKRVVLYITVGTGVGGGLVVDGAIYRGSGLAAMEIGHLRCGGSEDGDGATVESVASGRGIEAAARARLAASGDGAARELLEGVRGDASRLTAADIAAAARSGSALAREVIERAVRALGWAIGQAVTLLAPDVVVVGGGVSLMPRDLFLEPLAREAARAGFAPLEGSYEIVPAALGEEVVVHGALALARASVDASAAG